jgi:predicted dehydrogenase
MYRLASDLKICKRLPMGMIGGGVGSFFAPYHRAAMRLSDRWHLAAGVFSSDPEKSRSAGGALGVEEARVYPDAGTLAREERSRIDGVKAVAVVTPNHLHFDACYALLEAGIGVVCDKPLVNELEEARTLRELAKAKGVFFGMTYTYCGYPMVREARTRVLAGDIGPIRFAYGEYLQEWLADKPENLGAKAGGWRIDPAKAGPTGTMGDVGTHAFNLLEFVTAARVSELSATLLTTVEGRRLDDNDILKLRFDQGISGLVWATQAAPGHRNGLRFKLIGTRGSLEWRQEAPETLFIGRLGEPDSILHRGQRTMTPAGAREVTLPAGNPEGYLEALAILYSDFADAVGAEAGSDRPALPYFPYPDLEEGLRGVALCAAALESNRNDGRWTPLLV